MAAVAALLAGAGGVPRAELTHWRGEGAPRRRDHDGLNRHQRRARKAKGNRRLGSLNRRLNRAMGPGSYHCEEEIRRLVVARSYSKAHELAKRHWDQFNHPVLAVKFWTPAAVNAAALADGVSL